MSAERMNKKKQENNDKDDDDDDDVSSRVSVRPFRVTDADDLLSYMNDPKVGRYTALPWKEDGTMSKSEAESFIQSFCIPHRYCRSVCIDDRSVGVAIISPMGEGKGGRWRRGNCGLAVSPTHWVKGVGKRAAELVVAEVFGAVPEIVRLEGSAYVENVGIQKVMEAVGFQKEGVLRKYMFHRGDSRDVVMYSMLANDEKRLALIESMMRSRL